MSATCVCGLAYVPGHPDDEKLHDEFHDEYLNGPTLDALSALTPASRVGELALYIVDESVSKPLRRALSHVAMVAHRATPDYPAGYDGTITEDMQGLFVLAHGNRAIGMVVTAVSEYVWRMRWLEPGLPPVLEGDSQVAESRRVVCRLWIAARYRRKGLAREILAAASRHFDISVSEFAWELPFTVSGEAVVRASTKVEWRASGDGFALEQAIRRR